MSHAAALLRMLARIAPPGVACSAGEILDLPPSPYHEEEAAVRGVGAARQREFQAGRFHARQALGRLAAAPQAIPRLPSRAPRWPWGYVGSISHSPSLCVAVAAECRRLAGLGIDIEPLAPVPPRLAAAILAPGEVGEGFEHGLLRAFVAKEAVFKACGARQPGFRRIRLRWGPGETDFVARVDADVRPIAGAWGISQGHIVAIAWSEAPLSSERACR